MNTLSRRQALQLGVSASVAWSLAGCAESKRDPLRFGFHPWPGYALLGLAEDLGKLPRDLVKPVSTPSASASLRGLSNGVIEAAGLTLDEVLLAREQGTPLTVVAVVDQSLGADVVLAPEGVQTPAQLKGLRIGAEQTAVGALMVDATLRAAGLSATDVTIIDVSIDEHERAVEAGRIDAVVTYEPVKTRLLQKGLREVFSSAAIPGTIIDVLAVRTEVVEQYPDAVRALVAAFFAGREAWVRDAESQVENLSKWLSLASSEVMPAFDGLDLISLEDNRRWLQGSTRQIDAVARSVSDILIRSKLLQKTPDWSNFASGKFLDE